MGRTRSRIVRIERELNANRDRIKALESQNETLKEQLAAVMISLQEKLNGTNGQNKFLARKIYTLEERVDKLMVEKRELQSQITRLAWEVAQKTNKHEVMLGGINESVIKLQQRPRGFKAKLREMFGTRVRA